MNSQEMEYLKKLDKLCSTTESSTALEIRDFESRHQLLISNNYGRFIDQFNSIFSLISDCTFAINYVDKSTWPAHRGLQFLLHTHNLKTLFSAFDRLTKGFYEDGLSLSRTVYEALIKIIFLNCFPQSSSALFQNVKNVPNFKLDNFLKDNLKLDWHDHFLLSMMSHSNNYSVLKGWVELNRKKQTEPICLELTFEKRLFEIGINYIYFLLILYLKILEFLFITKTNSILTEDLLKKVRGFSELAIYFQGTHPLDYWPQVMKDIENISCLLQRTNEGEPWNAAWDSIKKKV